MRSWDSTGPRSPRPSGGSCLRRAERRDRERRDPDRPGDDRHLRRLGRPREAEARPGALRASPREAASAGDGIVGYARTGESDETYRAEMKAAVARVRAQEARRRGRSGRRSRRASFFFRGDLNDPEELRGPEGAPRDDREGTRHSRQPPLLPRDSAVDDRRRREEPRRGGSRLPGGRRPVVARHRREAVRARPRDRARPERGALARLPRAADLPHRPLPRQGDDAEHPRLPARERHLRAALEPPLRRPRADHGGRVASESRTAGSSTRKRASSATSSRTTFSSSSASSRWSRPSPSTRTPCATKR